MPARFDLLRDGCQVQRHRLDVAPGQHESGSFALLGADGTKDVGRGRALVLRCRGPGAATRPAPGQFVLLADAVERLRRSTVAEPDFQIGEINALRACDRSQAAGELLLKSSIAPSAWLW